MEIIQEIKKIGDSYYLKLPKELKNSLNLDLLEKLPKIKFEIKHIAFNDQDMKTFFCLVCNHSFSLEQDADLYCPSCQEENPRAFKEIKI